MAYIVLAATAYLLLCALTAIRPGRSTWLRVLAFPVGWAAGELAAQAAIMEGALIGVLVWWGWPHTTWLSVGVMSGATLVIALNLVLVAVLFHSRDIVASALVTATPPLVSARPSEDRFGTWWRTILQLSFHPRHMVLIKDLAYGPDRRQRLDIWRSPDELTDAPVMFFIHGGAWTFGDKREQGRPMLHELVARGWVVVTVNYRLAPKHPWPAQIEDVTAALAWTRGHIADYGGDPSRIVVSGASAGGQLAAVLALRDVVGDDASQAPVRGCVSLYGVLEMTGDEVAWNGRGEKLRELLEKFVVKMPLAHHPDEFREISPVELITAQSPCFLVIQGVNDTLVDVAVARHFVQRFKEVASAPIYYVELPFTQHAYDVTASPRTSATTRAVVAFANAAVGAVTPEPTRRG